MKMIRSKQNFGVFRDVVEESNNWYIDATGTTYSKEKWEGFADPVWDNVTSEIHIIEPFVNPHNKTIISPGQVMHKANCIAQLVCGGNYRLRICPNISMAYIEKRR